MKKNIIFMLIMIMVLNIAVTSIVDNAYGAEAEIIWLEKEYDEIYFVSEDLIKVGYKDKYGFINKSGKEIIPIKYDYIEEFSEGLARVGLNDKEGFLDKTGKEVVSIKYNHTS